MMCRILDKIALLQQVNKQLFTISTTFSWAILWAEQLTSIMEGIRYYLASAQLQKEL
uniref:Uncharacterized protein n=1 Tax=Arundo donax TaxID=35708 RepID=A0A0A8YX00_ARUDO